MLKLHIAVCFTEITGSCLPTMKPFKFQLKSVQVAPVQPKLTGSGMLCLHLVHR